MAKEFIELLRDIKYNIYPDILKAKEILAFNNKGEDTIENIKLKTPIQNDGWKSTTAGTLDSGDEVFKGDYIVGTGVVWYNIGPIAVAPLAIESIDTVVELTQALGEVTQSGTFNVRGYYAPNDGGGGIFNYDATQTGTNDGGIIVNGWIRQYSGMINVKWFGAKGDGVTDDTLAFQNATTWLDTPIYIPIGTYSLTEQATTDALFILEKTSIVQVNGAGWYPRRYQYIGDTDNVDKVNDAGSDPSPEIIDGEYPILDDAQAYSATVRNWWGKQHSDVNDNTKGRTAVDALKLKLMHYGEGDGYITRTNGTCYRHDRHLEITSVKGQNNIGMHNGQVSAGTDQVTLYGLGDMVLNDQGYDSVALRGQVIILYANGVDSYGYDVDRFGYMVWSNGLRDIDVGFIPRGKMRIGMDTTGAILSSNSALTMAGGQKIFFNGTGASTQSGYGSTDQGEYWIGADNVNNYTEIGSKGSLFRLKENYAEYTPALESGASFRIYGTSQPSTFIGLGQSGNTAFISADTSGVENTFLVFRTALNGIKTNQMTIKQTGVVNITNAPTYADDASAGTGGLVAGDIYTTSTGELRIKL